jgi:hypothetical protein
MTWGFKDLYLESYHILHSQEQSSLESYIILSLKYKHLWSLVLPGALTSIDLWSFILPCVFMSKDLWNFTVSYTSHRYGDSWNLEPAAFAVFSDAEIFGTYIVISPPRRGCLRYQLQPQAMETEFGKSFLRGQELVTYTTVMLLDLNSKHLYSVFFRVLSHFCCSGI